MTDLSVPTSPGGSLTGRGRNNGAVTVAAALLGLGALFGLFGKRKLVGSLLAAGGAAGIAVGIGWLK